MCPGLWQYRQETPSFLPIYFSTDAISQLFHESISVSEIYRSISLDPFYLFIARETA